MTNRFLPSSEEDPFELFGVPAVFDLDLSELWLQYRSAMLRCHPDQFLGAPLWLQQAAQRRAREVNGAYHQLKDPFLRAEALLKRQGIFPNREKMALEDLLWVMDFSERLERISGDTEREEIREEIGRAMASFTREMQRAFREARWRDALRCYQKAFFLRRALGRTVTK